MSGGATASHGPRCRAFPPASRRSMPNCPVGLAAWRPRRTPACAAGHRRTQPAHAGTGPCFRQRTLLGRLRCTTAAALCAGLGRRRRGGALTPARHPRRRRRRGVACAPCPRCRRVGALVAWLPGPMPATLRRLQLLAEKAARLIFLFRPAATVRESSPAPLRRHHRRQRSRLSFTAPLQAPWRCPRRAPLELDLASCASPTLWLALRLPLLPLEVFPSPSP